MFYQRAEKSAAELGFRLFVFLCNYLVMFLVIMTAVFIVLRLG